MTIVEFITNYGDTIVATIAFIATVTPFMRTRSVNDKNLLEVFENVKETAKKVNFKEIDIVHSIDRIDGSLSTFKKDFIENQERIETTISDFKDSEFVAEMRDGVAMMREFKQVLAQKDATIETMMNQFKTITKEIQEIKNQLRV